MRRGLVWALGAALLFMLNLPAAAEPPQGGEVIDITKCIYLKVKQDKEVQQMAEASATKEDWSHSNKVIEETITIPGNNILEEPDTYLTVVPEALIHDSVFNEFHGIVTLNQSPGNITNQGNAVATAFAQCADAFLHAKAKAEKIMGQRWDQKTESFIGEGNCFEAAFTPRTNTITNCLIGVRGLVAINQSTGNINNQNNAVAMAVSDKAAACLADSQLELISGGNFVKELAVTKLDVLEGHIFTGSGSSGIVAINQATGNICNQANAVSSCLLAPF